jgi:hypothetical protein
MGPHARMAAGNAPFPEAGDSANGTGPFVINLCSSTTPMALSHPDSPELKRFSFFVSRRREDNRERFRLHMGYFRTLAEAEEWLNVIRDVYPGAWAGEAPGKKLRARAAAAAMATQLPSPPSSARPPASSNATRVSAALPALTKPAVAVTVRPAAVSKPPNIAVPTLRAAAPVASSASRVAAPAKAPAPPTRAPAASPVQPPPLAGRRAVPAPPPSAIRAAANPPRRPGAPAVPPPAKSVARRQGAQTALSNIREVLTSLDETGETRQMRVPAGLRPPARETAAPPARARALAPAAAAAPRPEPAPSASSLSDTQVLKILEDRRSEDADRSNEDVSSGISLLKPDDTQTRRALKEAVQDNAPVSFAVQLYWSVQPVELDKVPPLAIFSAYTLYTVEGSREGRKWYGLRLGFFSDAISAKQVAYYVRSEFTSVAVVPVSPAEKGRASDEENRAAGSALMKKRVQQQKVEEFKLFDDDKAARSEPAPAPKPAAAAAPVAKSAPVKKNKPLGKVRAKESRPQKTLEETLEILGASELEIDNGRGETLNDTGVRHLRVQVSKNTPFAKLLDRLSERVRRG